MAGEKRGEMEDDTSTGLAELAPIRMLELTTAYWAPQAISVAATLGVADVLASGACPVEQIAELVGADPSALYRLLSPLADLGVFRELDGRRFESTEVGDLLRSDAPASMRGWARLVGLPAWRDAWTDLLTSVRTGEPAFERVHGQHGFDYMSDHLEEAGIFNDAMAVLSRMLIIPVVQAFDFSQYRTVVDVGGGSGNLISAILVANPTVQGVLFDLPYAIESAGPLLKEAGVTDRCAVVGGSFFDTVPVGCYAYVLSSVIHDWDDEHAVQILRNCRSAAAPGNASVLLIQPVLPEGPEPSMAKVMDLEALVVTPGGRERTESELRSLLARVDLELKRVVPAGLYSVVEAVCA
jgi:hypothetical protein